MKYGIYPAPVYEATFAGGETIRMSFWNAPKKPLDFDGARRLVCQVIAAERHRVRLREAVEAVSRQMKAAELAKRPGTEGERKAAERAVRRLAKRTGKLPHVQSAFDPGHEGAVWERDSDGKLVRRVPIAADIVSGVVHRKDPGHHGETVVDPFFAPEAATVHRAKRSPRRLADDGALAAALARIADLEATLAKWENDRASGAFPRLLTDGRLAGELEAARSEIERLTADLEFVRGKLALIRGVMGKLAA